MSYTVILIGFSYEFSGEKTISSVILDIYRMYLAIGHEEYINFYIVTDISDIPDVVIKGLIENEVTSDILNFIPGEHTEVKHNNLKWLICNNLQDWYSIYKSFTTTDISRLLLYYTGHGNTNSNILFPSKQELPLTQLRDMTLDLCIPDAEIVYIIDCCYSGSLDMPYKLETTSETYSLVNDKYFFTQNILVISSCSNSQISYSELFGSHFTSKFLKAVEKTSNLTQLIKDIYLQSKMSGTSTNTTSEVQIHSSYPTTPTFWSWIFQHNKGKRSDIYINDNINCLIVSQL